MAAHIAAESLPLLLPELPALDNTLGALLIATGITSILCGLSIHQTYRYFKTYVSDPRPLKVMVALLCTLDTVHEMMAIHLCYFYLITNYFNPIRLLSGVWSLRLILTVTGVIATITHLFFARRVFILSGRKKMYPLGAAILVTAELAFCITATVITFVDVTYARFQEHSAWIIYAALGLRVATDLILTGALIFYLHHSRTGFKKTDTMIDVLILYAVNTGGVTSMFSLATVIAAATMPDNLIYISIYIVSSKLYSSSVLAVLNSRKSLSKLGGAAGSTGTSWLEMDVQSPPVSQTRVSAREAIEFAVRRNAAITDFDHDELCVDVGKSFAPL